MVVILFCLEARVVRFIYSLGETLLQEYVLCFISVSLIKILSFATTMTSDETHSLGLPDFPIDNVQAIVQILVIHLVC